RLRYTSSTLGNAEACCPSTMSALRPATSCPCAFAPILNGGPADPGANSCTAVTLRGSSVGTSWSRFALYSSARITVPGTARVSAMLLPRCWEAGDGEGDELQHADPELVPPDVQCQQRT